ncbi:hypothetical protein FD754_014218 [Muntiacus muntjak]|uniref:Uncharacterized protein n=1 Tax=Muntiacus muntjak TaxID=9888 RepID=A0A5N3VJC8_MUNMU|nr:hypothetical protein FD754_014218 [Muntiacus muntjak]
MSSDLSKCPIPDVGKGERQEKKEEDGTGPGLPGTPKNCLPRRDISVLEKLVKTCPVWLQLGLGRAEAARILHREAPGNIRVRGTREIILHPHFTCEDEGLCDRIESGLPCPSPGDLPNPGIELRSPALQADSLPSEEATPRYEVGALWTCPAPPEPQISLGGS